MRPHLFALALLAFIAGGCSAGTKQGSVPPVAPPVATPPAPSDEPTVLNDVPGVYFLQFEKQEGSVLHAGLYHSRSGLVRTVNFSYMLGQPFQFDGGQFYYINKDSRLVRLDVAQNTETLLPWQKVTSFWVDEGLFVYFTQDYCGEGIVCNVLVADLRTLKVTKTLARNLPKLVDAGPGVVYISPAKSNDRALALLSGYGDGPGGYSKFWALDVDTGKLSLVAETSYISIDAVCGDGSEPTDCNRVKIEADNKKHEAYVAEYLPHGGSCGSRRFSGTKEFYNPGDSWFVGCEGN